jgi:drug/metabolite transporter (DMT)-like permease
VKAPSTVSQPLAYVMMGMTVIIWASSFAGIRYMLDRMDVMPFTALRLTIGVAGMVALGALARSGLPRREHLGRTLVAGLCAFSLYHIALNYGAARVSAGQAALVVATIPVWTAFAAWRALGEAVSARHVQGLLISLVGVGLMSLAPDDLDVPIGSLFVLLSTFFAAAAIVMQKSLLVSYRPLDLTVHVATLGSIPLILWLPTQADALGSIDSTGWAVITYLALGPITLGYWLSTIALKALPAYRTSQFLLFIPPIAVLIAWLILDEVPTERMVAGGALVLAGVALTIKRPSTPET